MVRAATQVPPVDSMEPDPIHWKCRRQEVLRGGRVTSPRVWSLLNTPLLPVARES